MSSRDRAFHPLYLLLAVRLAEKKKMAWQQAELVVEAVFASMEQSLRRVPRLQRGHGGNDGEACRRNR